MTQPDLSTASLTDEALDAFWQVIAGFFPHATAGDLSPEQTQALHQAAEAAVKEWIANNVTPGGFDHA